MINQTIDKVSAHDFIIAYRAAIKCNISREQFASYTNMLVSSVGNRRLKLEQKFGIDLNPLLPLTGVSEFDNDDLETFKDMCKNINDNIKVSTVKEVRNESKTYVITSAQNATPIHDGFLKCIENYCDINSAELMVIPYRYRNPTSLWVDKDHDWWHASIKKYINDKNIELCKGLQVMGHIKMQPTAVAPLSGFDSYTSADSGIFGHPKVQLKTIPTPSKRMPKILTTTGAITEPNYTDSKSGHKGEFHHSISAVVVEVTENEFHIRHIHTTNESGEFYDLNTLYMQNKIKSNTRISALITGDTHIEFLDSSVDNATYTDSTSIVNTLQPENIIYHDLQDFYARNHWHRGNDILSVGKHRYGHNSVEAGLQSAADFIDRNAREDMTSVVVKSNHDEAFDRWLKETDPKYDPENCQFYYYMKYHQLDNIYPTDNGFATIDPFKFWCEFPESYPGLKSFKDTVFLSRHDSFQVHDVELGYHGDAGPNGSRGTITSMSKIGPKIVIGHSHTPGIYEGVYQVGLSSILNLEYARGPSSWLHTHCIIYPNGARTLINIVNGKWQK